MLFLLVNCIDQPTQTKMKYTLHITINAPLHEVVTKLDSVANMKHWQRGFISYEHLNGKEGHEGATSLLKYKMGKRNFEMIETITKKNLPNAFHVTYDTKGVHNIQENFFEEIDEHTTQWTSVSQFQFSSFGMKFFGLIMPGAFKKQSYIYMKDFKNFVEKGTSVAHA